MVEWLPCAGDGPSALELRSCSLCVSGFPSKSTGPSNRTRFCLWMDWGAQRCKCYQMRAAENCGKKLKEEKIMRLGCLKSGLFSEALWETGLRSEHQAGESSFRPRVQQLFHCLLHSLGRAGLGPAWHCLCPASGCQRLAWSEGESSTASQKIPTNSREHLISSVIGLLLWFGSVLLWLVLVQFLLTMGLSSTVSTNVGGHNKPGAPGCTFCWQRKQ